MQKNIIFDDTSDFNNLLTQNSILENDFSIFANYNNQPLTTLFYNHSHSIKISQPSQLHTLQNHNILMPCIIPYEFLEASHPHDHSIFQIFHNTAQINSSQFNLTLPLPPNISLTNFDSNITDDDFLNKVDQIKQMIHSGDFSQANLTRKFSKTFSHSLTTTQILAIFLHIQNAKKPPQSAFIKHKNQFILSFSPECFLNITNNTITSQPIKGTVNTATDISTLTNQKNMAENIMITDMTRNDLSKISKINSVEVTDLCKPTQGTGVINLVSTIKAKLLSHVTFSDVLQATFPPPSMTGTPKSKVISVLKDLEGINRGIYSGCIGFLNPSTLECHLNIVIRTLIIKNNKKSCNFSYNCGCGITFLSDKHDELQELYSKIYFLLTAF